MIGRLQLRLQFSSRPLAQRIGNAISEARFLSWRYLTREGRKDA